MLCPSLRISIIYNYDWFGWSLALLLIVLRQLHDMLQILWSSFLTWKPIFSFHVDPSTSVYTFFCKCSRSDFRVLFFSSFSFSSIPFLFYFRLPRSLFSFLFLIFLSTINFSIRVILLASSSRRLTNPCLMTSERQSKCSPSISSTIVTRWSASGSIKS